MSDSLVIIPTFNEKENITRILDAVMHLPVPFHVLVVDDGSPDGTADLVKQKMDEFPGKIFMEQRTGKLGLGTAYIHGFKWGLKNGYEYMLEMDADFSHNPKDLVHLREACVKGYDLSVGSRYTKGGKIENWPIDRVLMSYFASVYVRMVLWIGVKDTTAGFMCYTRRVLETLNLDDIKFIGYAFQIEMKYRSLKRGFKLYEVPITFIDREFGESKMSMSIFKEAILGVLKMRFLKL